MNERRGISGFWAGLGAGSRAGLVIGVVLSVVLAGWLLFWATDRNYQVLFSQLAAADAAAVVEQLKRQKMPFHLADQGTTVEVPGDRVHETRLALMSSNLPLSGGVGFEIFDRQGLGATEQSQRVSYQRALQGELARTIGTLDSVKQARVHLVISDASLFRRDRQEARAAVILTLRPGASLSPEQIAGVQRLVAASVAGLDSSKVVVTDQRGVTLSRSDPMGGPIAMADAQLGMKREVEDYVTAKVVALLDRALGPGRAIVSVDATLNFDEIRRTVQDVIPNAAGGASSVARRRDAVRAVEPGSDLVLDSEAPATDATASSSSEVEYELGRRVEQVVAAPGSVRRLTISVVVPANLDIEERARVSDLVAAAAGMDPARGDAVVIRSLVAEPGPVASSVTAPVASEEEAIAAPPGKSPAATAMPSMWQWLVGVAIIMILLAFVLMPRRRVAGLSAEERAQLVAEIESTLGEGRRPEGAGGAA